MCMRRSKEDETLTTLLLWFLLTKSISYVLLLFAVWFRGASCESILARMKKIFLSILLSDSNDNSLDRAVDVAEQ